MAKTMKKRPMNKLATNCDSVKCARMLIPEIKIKNPRLSNADCEALKKGCVSYKQRV